MKRSRPQLKRIDGRISIVQESRFRLVARDGRTYLFTLDGNAGIHLRQLAELSMRSTAVRVEFSGEPNMTTGIAHRVRVISAMPQRNG